MNAEENITAHASINIHAEPMEVWKALTDPAMIKQYLFGTDASSDWKEGSSITYKGTWEGKEYEDKGTVIQSEPGKILQTTYWSSMAGTEDKPENYANVTYKIDQEGNGSRLTITQDHCKTEESRLHSEKNWHMVLESLKKLLEGAR